MAEKLCLYANHAKTQHVRSTARVVMVPDPAPLFLGGSEPVSRERVSENFEMFWEIHKYRFFVLIQYVTCCTPPHLSATRIVHERHAPAPARYRSARRSVVLADFSQSYPIVSDAGRIAARADPYPLGWGHKTHHRVELR